MNKSLVALLLLTMSGTALSYHHTVTNNTNNQIRIEGFNTANQHDLYFSELVEPGETKSYMAGTHYPNFAIRVMQDSNESLQLNPNAKISTQSQALPSSGTHVAVTQKGDKHTISVEGH